MPYYELKKKLNVKNRELNTEDVFMGINEIYTFTPTIHPDIYEIYYKDKLIIQVDISMRVIDWSDEILAIIVELV